MSRPSLGIRFDQAVDLACELHRKQSRKGTSIPYVAHLLAVASIVLEHGGGEDEAIAALLHDAVEDQGGAPMLARIRSEFGEHVASIVATCTDSDAVPKPPWRERKERYLSHLQEAAPEARLVSLADKVHNARSILADYRVLGDELWGRFQGGREGTLWYYRSLTETFQHLAPGALADELRRVVDELERLARVAKEAG